MRPLATLCVLFVFSFPGRAFAESGQSAWCGEEPCLPPKYDESRTVNGHAFLPMQTVPFAFVTTRVGSVTGMGVVDLESIPVEGVGDIQPGNDPKLVLFTQSFIGDFKLTRYLGLSTGFAVGNAVGVNDSGAFNLGINYAYGARLGLIVRLAKGTKWYLSLRVNGILERAEAVLPAALAESVSNEDGQITYAISSLTQSGRIGNGWGELILAYSPHRAIGLTAAAGYRTTHLSVGDESGRFGQVLMALGSSWRFNSVGVPLAFTLGGSLGVRTDESQRVFFPTIGSSGTTNGYVEGGILYSDPKFVDVGIQTVWSVAKNDNRKQALLVINHFW